MASSFPEDQLKHLPTLKGVKPKKESLGRGCYGNVFVVEHKRSRYAAKEIHSFLVDISPEKKEELKKDFLRECYHSSLIHHPNIVSFIGIYYTKQSDLPIMVTELLTNNLPTFVEKNQTRIAMKTKFSILFHVSLGLSHLHGIQPPVVHRNLSSYNVLLNADRDTEGLVAKIGDMGMAKMIKADSKQTKSRLKAKPSSIDFLPPEVDGEYGTPVDVFAFAGIALHLFSEKWPTPCKAKGRNPITRKLIAFSEPQRRQQYLDKVEDAILKEMIIQCLDDDPIERPPIEDVSKMVEHQMQQHIKEDVPNNKEEKPPVDPKIPNAAKKVYEEFRIKLMKCLPMDDAIFLELLRKSNLFPGDLQEQVEKKDTKANKTAWFLDHAIKPSLDVDIVKPLHKLLTVMSDDEYVKSDVLKEIAAKMRQQLDKETPV